MAKIVVRCQQQNVLAQTENGRMPMLKYVARPVRYTTMRADDIVEYCASNSIVPKAYMSAALVACVQCIHNFLLNGHSVELPNLGIFSLGSDGFTVADPANAGVDQIDKLKVNFLPNARLKDEVANVQMECEGIYEIASTYTDQNGQTKHTYRKLSGGSGSNFVPENEITNSGGGQATIALSIPNAMLAMGDIQINTRTKAKSDSLTVDSGTSVTIKATPANADYQFTGWSDGETDATRSVTVTDDISLQAMFAPAE